MRSAPEPLSLKALLTLINATEHFRDQLLGRLERGEPHFPDADEDDLRLYADQVEDTLDELERHYDALRLQNPALMPFTEMLKNRRPSR